MNNYKGWYGDDTPWGSGGWFDIWLEEISDGTPFPRYPVEEKPQ
jgi:hypothetical protein